jgi:methyl-accepting chemotaxis protein
MKVNLPVTQKEIEVREDHSIVSKTDLKGIITYVNRDFIEISGYHEAELLGKNHNLIRHPDMPSAAFKDLWHTARAERPWTGLVKNRAKNGDFYWVRANVTPIWEGGQVTGYMSVRHKASRAEIEEAEHLYRLMNAGKMPGAGWRAFLGKLTDRSLRSLLIGGGALALVLTSVLLYLFLAASGGIEPAPRWLGLGCLLSLYLLATAGLLYLDRRINTPLAQAVACIRALAQGDYRAHVPLDRNDELGRLLEGIKSLQIRMGTEMAETRRLADETTRIKNALDHASTNLLIADSNLDIIYVNNALTALLRAAEEAIRTDLPEFRAAALTATGADRFYGNPAEARRLLQSLTAPQHSVTHFGDRTFKLIANPVFDDRGERFGCSIEWLDITQELKVQEDVSRLVEAVLARDFSRRISLEDKFGFMRQLSDGMNKTLDILAETFQHVAQSSRMTAAASTETSTAISQIADGAQHQMHTINQVSVAIRQTAESVSDISENTETANKKAQESVALVLKGKEEMQRMVAVVNNIATSSLRINKITDVIERIANKTNLLSLNAAIEAARAGEHGKGFAVVADEVGKLAATTAESAQEIAQLVQQAAVEARQAVDTVRAVDEDMDRIAEASRQEEAMLQRIAAALEQQRVSVQEIKANMDSLNRIGTANAAASEEITATVVELAKLANDTRGEVDKFKF